MPASCAQNYEVTREPKDEWVAICGDHDIPWMGEQREERDDAHQDAFRHNQQFHGGHAVVPVKEMMDASMEQLEVRRRYSYKLERRSKIMCLAMVPFCGFMYGWVLFESPLMTLSVAIVTTSMINMGYIWGKIHTGNKIAEREHQKLKEQISGMVSDDE